MRRNLLLSRICWGREVREIKATRWKFLVLQQKAAVAILNNYKPIYGEKHREQVSYQI